MGTVVLFVITPLFLRFDGIEGDDFLRFEAGLLFSEVYYSSFSLRRRNYVIKFSNLTVSSINRYSENGSFMGTTFYSETGIKAEYLFYLNKIGLSFISGTGFFYDGSQLQPFLNIVTVYNYKNFQGSLSFNYDLLSRYTFSDLFFSLKVETISLKFFVNDFYLFPTTELSLNSFYFSPEFHAEIYYTILPLILGLSIYDRGDFGFFLGIKKDISIQYTVLTHKELSLSHRIGITKNLR